MSEIETIKSRLFPGKTTGNVSRKNSIALGVERALSPGSTTKAMGAKISAWNEDTIYALGFYRLIARIAGIWPLECHRIGSKIRFLTVIILQVFMIYNLAQEIRSGCVPTSLAVHFIGIIAANVVGLLKIFTLRMHHKKMRSIVEAAVNNWSIVRDRNSRKTMLRHAFIGRFVCMFQFGIPYTSIALLVLDAPPTLEMTIQRNWRTSNLSDSPLRNLPIGTGCSVKNTPQLVYVIFYFLQVIQCLIVAICNCGSDCIFFGLAIHICSQLELLKINVTQFGRHLNEGNASDEMAALVQRQNELTKLCSYVEDIFNVIILGQLAGTAVQITFVGVQMLMGLQNKDYGAIVNPLMVITILCIQLFMYSYVGDYLVSQIAGLRDAAYNCSWYNFAPRVIKDVKFVIMRSTDSFHLTAGKVYRINIENFTGIIKTMASFFSVVKLMLAE